MSGLAVIPHPMEEMTRIRTTRAEVTFDERIGTVPETISSTEAAARPSQDFIFVKVFHLALQLLSPIRVVSATEIDIDRDAMVTGKRYQFELGDVYLVAVKQGDGSIDVFSVP